MLLRRLQNASELRERRHQTLFTDQMAVHILELTKFHKAADELASSLDCWLYFLRHATTLDMDSLPESLDKPEIRWAFGDLMMMSQSELERERYESYLKKQRDVYTAMAEKFDEGLERGREQGLEQGREEARAEERRALLQYLQKRLGHDVLSSEQLQALSAAELASLVTRLQAELDAKLGVNS